MIAHIERAIRKGRSAIFADCGPDSARLATHLYVVAGMALQKAKGQGCPKLGSLSSGDAARYRDMGVKFANDRGVRIGLAAGSVA